MRRLLDTNVWIYAMSAEPSSSRALLISMADEWCGYSAMTRLEVLSHSSLTPSDIADWRALLAGAAEVPVSDAVVEEAARLRRTVRMKTPDAIIAATALLENAALVTRNIGDFRRVPDLKVIEPATV